MSNYSIIERSHLNIATLIIITMMLSACSSSEDKQANTQASISAELIHSEQTTPNLQITLSPTTALFIKLVNEHFSNLINASKLLNESLINFTKKPSKEGLQRSIESLENTHSLFVSAYFLDNCCLIYTKKLSSDDNDLQAISIKTRLDQQPLLPGYLDVVDGYPFSGLIYSDMPITRENMEREFQLGDPNYVTLGFHALELILKGSNLKRKVSDFAKLTNTEDSSSEPAELRRTLYAILLASEIETDIAVLKSNWEESIRTQISQLSEEQNKSFFLDLALNVEKELNALQKQQLSMEQQKQREEEHVNQTILALKKSLLEKLSELNK